MFIGVKIMDENSEKLLRMKENELVKAFERNNMTCLIVKNRDELMTYLKNRLVQKRKLQLEEVLR